MDWGAGAERLLYDGETVEERVSLGESGVVVTSHRVLVFTPEREGPNFRQVDRPNVDGVGRRTSGEGRLLEGGLKALVAGVALVGAGQLVSLDSLASGVSLEGGSAATAPGLGGMMGTLQTMLSLVARLDDLMVLFGGLALALSAVALGVYAWSREQLLIIEVAGGDDVELPAPADGGAIDRLRGALLPGDAPPEAGQATPPVDDPLA
ncbi:hypothetical protein [Haloarcula nitratireducens]|uniref:Uncharacterized protein n=1 Tax=Haloarcula nitratireducens TaxID=2487749 RepID=A0AAW4PCM8_9EURY|nr:hypothetical protein [Halomicroarcula nitratireducens]MBX0295727.1 hypothetical protein [Halomicroarcula nitratireducens]